MLTASGVAVLVLIALLAVPVTLDYQLCWRRALQGRIRLRWLFGLVRMELPLPQPGTTTSRVTPGPPPKPKKSNAGKRPKPMAALQQRAFRRRIIRFLRDFWQAISKRNIKLHVRIGLGDPADTGQLWAVVGPVSGMLATIQDASIEIEPEFIDAVFELDSSGNIRVMPLQMLYLATALLLSPSIWRGILQMHRAA